MKCCTLVTYSGSRKIGKFYCIM